MRHPGRFKFLSGVLPGRSIVTGEVSPLLFARIAREYLFYNRPVSEKHNFKTYIISRSIQRLNRLIHIIATYRSSRYGLFSLWLFLLIIPAQGQAN